MEVFFHITDILELSPKDFWKRVVRLWNYDGAVRSLMQRVVAMKIRREQNNPIQHRVVTPAGATVVDAKVLNAVTHDPQMPDVISWGSEGGG